MIIEHAERFGLNDAKVDAFAIVDKDPQLNRADHLQLKAVLLQRWGSYINRTKTD
jgi:hypothetical protein